MALVISTVIKSLVLIVLLLSGFAYLTYYERKLLARFHGRLGPNRAGPRGLLQPIADAVKAIFKEEIIPDHVDKVVYVLAPALSLIPALVVWAVIPIAPPVVAFGYPITFQIADINVAVLYIVAITSVATYGIILAGWSSNNNYSLMGAVRTASQMISYELPLGLLIVAIVLTTNIGRETGSMSLNAILDQTRPWWLWLWLWLAFPLFFICMLAESNRSPFDLPETENELIAGFQVEYGGIKFALFFMAEYIGMITGSAIMATLFFGGWHGPFATPNTWYGPIVGFGWFFLKILALLFIYIWVRASMPRVRYDQLLKFCWKFLVPVSILYLALTAIIVVLAA